LRPIPSLGGWTSPRLGVRFGLSPETLTIHGPDDRPFVTPLETAQQRGAQQRHADELAHQRNAERQ
jgi:hypothetical protein